MRYSGLSVAEALARLERVTLPRRELLPSALPEHMEEVSAAQQAVLDEAAGGVRIVVVVMADGRARRELLTDWARRHAGEFPGGQAYVDLQDLSDPAAALAWLLEGLGVPEDLVPARPWERAWALRQVTARRPAVVVVDGARQAAEARWMACSQGSLLLVGSGRRISGLERDGAVQISLDGPDGCRSREDAGAVEASLSPAARTLRRLLGSLPVRTTGYAIAEALLGSSPDQAVAELRMAGLLEDGGAAGRFRLSDDAWRRSQPVEEDLRTVTGACLAVVERAAALVAGGASGKQRRAAWETLDREQHMVSHLLDRISGLPWHREKWRLAAALLPLYGERTYSSWWRQNLTHGIDGAFVDGAMDVLAGLYAQLACMELRYGDDERRAETAAECAGDLLGQVGSGRVRGRIWQARAEVAERFWGDPVPGWREAHRWWEAEGEQAAADAADVRLGEALLADGQAEQALAVLAGGRETRELAGARARLVRAAAHRALERPGLALAEAVVAAEEAVRTRQYRLYDQSLRLLCDLAEGQGDDGRLLRVCRARRTELGDATGLGVRWLEAGPSDPAVDSRP